MLCYTPLLSLIRAAGPGPANDQSGARLSKVTLTSNDFSYLEIPQCVEVAATLRRMAEELEQDIEGWEGELLTVQQAVAESGYSAEYWRRLVREGKIRAHRDSGSKSHIRVWRRDLPKKQGLRRPSKRGVNRLAGYDPEEDARDIAQHLAR